MILPSGATVAVMDGSRFRLLRTKGVAPHLALRETAAGDVAGDNAGSGSRHHNGSSNPDRSRLAEDNYAAAVAARLNEMKARREISQLLLIADPRTLGEVRRHLGAALRDKVVGEISKDLVASSPEAIMAAIQDFRGP